MTSLVVRAASGTIAPGNQFHQCTARNRSRQMTSLLKDAAIAAALWVPYAAAKAQQPQGSNQALGYEHSHRAASAGFSRAYAHYGRHRHHRRY
jgi:hypothetical protein